MKMQTQARSDGVPRRRRRLFRLGVFVVAALVSAACSDSSANQSGTTSSDPTPADGTATEPTGPDAQPITTDDTPLVDPTLPTISFESTDGSAFPGSRAVLTLTNAATGDAILVPVDAQIGGVTAEVAVAPGSYRITTSGPQVSPTATYTVRDVTPTEVTIAADAPAGQSAASVSFGLDVQTTPLDLVIETLTATGIELSWQNLSGAEIAAYDVRRTPGSVAAANPTDGSAVSATDPTAVSAVAQDLEPGTAYTFTLFATTTTGEVLPPRSVSATTSTLDGDEPSYALAANAIVPDDFAALQPVLIAESQVQISLDPANGDRASATAMPGIEAAALDGGCVVGLPVLVSTEVAGDNAFYGVIDACGPTTAKSSFRAGSTSPAGTAIVNTDVPLAAIFPYLSFKNAAEHRCIDASGQELGAANPLCKGQDLDGDGVNDISAFGAESFFEPPAATPTPDGTPAPAPDLSEVVAPTELATGDVQVALLWTTGDDLDLYVVDPAGNEISYTTPTSSTGGTLDIDDLGDATCQSTATRAENIIWATNAPQGVYTVRAERFDGSGSPACTNPVQARLQITVKGRVVTDEVITIGSTAPTSFVIAPAGSVTTSVSWNSRDGISVEVNRAGSSGWLDNTGPNGTPYRSSAEQGYPECPEIEQTGTFTVKEPVITGSFNVTMSNNTQFGTKRCRQPVEVRLQVRIDDAVVLDKPYTFTADQVDQGIRDVVPITVVAAAPASSGFRRPESAASTPLAPAAPVAARKSATFASAVPTSRTAAGPSVECEGSGGTTFDPGFGFDEFHDTDVTLKLNELQWDIEAGITAYVDPTIKIEGEYSCELDIEGVTFQLTTTPVPINLELKPAIDGSVSGSFELRGPRLEVTFGVASTGRVNATMETCGWFLEVPCGVDIDTYATASPIGKFTYGPAVAKLEAELKINVGIEATLGVGIKNDFVTAKSGFAIKMQPASATLAGSAGISVALPGSTQTSPVTTPADDELVADASTLDCPDSRAPVTVELAEGTRHACPDADCVSSGGTPVYTVIQGCFQATCYSTGEVINANTFTNSRIDPASGEIVTDKSFCPRERTEETTAESLEITPSGCLTASLGAHLGVDFRAEAFVLAWGKDKRYTIYEDDFAYPGADFTFGDCPPGDDD